MLYRLIVAALQNCVLPNHALSLQHSSHQLMFLDSTKQTHFSPPDKIKASTHSWGLWGGAEHLCLVNTNNDWLMEASSLCIINLSVQHWACWHFSFWVFPLRIGSWRQSSGGCHLETLCCHLQKFDALNRSWHPLTKHCWSLCVFVHFWEGSSASWNYLHMQSSPRYLGVVLIS